jgi:hypothetical protein
LSEVRQALNRLEGFVAYAQEMIPNNQLKSRAERVRGDWMLVQETVEQSVVMVQELAKLRQEILDSEGDSQVQYPPWFCAPTAYQLELFAEGRQETSWLDTNDYAPHSEELCAGLERLVQGALACNPTDATIAAGVSRFTARRGGSAPSWQALLDEVWELCDRWRRNGRREADPEQPVESVSDCAPNGGRMVPRETCDCDMCREVQLLYEQGYERWVPLGTSSTAERPE